MGNRSGRSVRPVSVGEMWLWADLNESPEEGDQAGVGNALSTVRVRDYSRVLDMRAGTLVRELVWSTPSGKHVQPRSQRPVSWERRHLMAVCYKVTLLDHPAPVVVYSVLLNHQDQPHQAPAHDRVLTDPRLGKVFTGHVLNLGHRRDVRVRRTVPDLCRVGIDITAEVAAIQADPQPPPEHSEGRR